MPRRVCGELWSGGGWRAACALAQAGEAAQDELLLLLLLLKAPVGGDRGRRPCVLLPFVLNVSVESLESLGAALRWRRAERESRVARKACMPA